MDEAVEWLKRLGPSLTPQHRKQVEQFRMKSEPLVQGAR